MPVGLVRGQSQTGKTPGGLNEYSTSRLRLITDVPIDEELRSWSDLIDQSILHWKSYFGVGALNEKQLSVTAFLILDQNRFQADGFLNGVPAFDEGYQFGNRLFLREQPSIYYRRHLFLHEATHWIMSVIYGGGGPPWYMEGMAEFQGTHGIQDGRLQLGIIPASPQQVPYWGRLKAIDESLNSGTAPSLSQILAFQNDRDRTVRYAWSWAACTFFSMHPKYSGLLSQARGEHLDYSYALNRKLMRLLESEWAEVNLDWNGFISDLDFGYSPTHSMVQTGAIPHATTLGQTQKVVLATDRGWQCTGIRASVQQKIKFDCQGRFRIKSTSGQPDWESEPQGITIEYYRGLPIGCVIATVQSDSNQQNTKRWEIHRIGRGNTIQSTEDGMLYLKINEPSRALSDNRGTIEVQITLE